MPLMTVNEICRVISAWIKEEVELGSKFEWVQIFENKGEIMGCSNPHPHCQIWASSFLPNEPRLEDARQREYWNRNKRLLLRDYLLAELAQAQGNRIVLSNDSWVVLVSVSSFSIARSIKIIITIIIICLHYQLTISFFPSLFLSFSLSPRDRSLRFRTGHLGHLKHFSCLAWMLLDCLNCHPSSKYIWRK